jgi:hypothetical protein
LGFTVLVPFVVGLPSIFLLDGVMWDDPFFVAVARLLVVPAKMLGGYGLTLAELLTLGLAWVASVGLAILALSWPYELSADTGNAVPTRAEALSRERTHAFPRIRRLFAHLRTPYIDFGPDSAMVGLLGRNLTASLRVPFVLMNVVPFLLLFPMFLVFRFEGSAFDVFTFAMIALMAMFTSSMGAICGMPLLQDPPDIVDVLPLRPREYYLAYAGPPLLFGALTSGVVAVGTVAAGAPATWGILVFALSASASFHGVTAALHVGGVFASVGLASRMTARATVGMAPLVAFMILMMFEAILLISSWNLREGWAAYISSIAFLNMGLGGLWFLPALSRFRRPRRF